MQLRYRYRLYPDGVQRRALAQAFGNARVVFNDAVRAGRDAYASGEKHPTGTVLQKRLITEAKRTDERGWLAECSNIVLQQAIRDADAAYKNFFDSLKGKRTGKRVRARRELGHVPSPVGVQSTPVRTGAGHQPVATHIADLLGVWPDRWR